MRVVCCISSVFEKGNYVIIILKTETMKIFVAHTEPKMTMKLQKKVKERLSEVKNDDDCSHDIIF
jgi:hypothetical protein